MTLDDALTDFAAKIKAATGRDILDREVANFHRQVAVAEAHQQPRVVHIGLCDFQTLSGSATAIEVRF